MEILQKVQTIQLLSAQEFFLKRFDECLTCEKVLALKVRIEFQVLKKNFQQTRMESFNFAFMQSFTFFVDFGVYFIAGELIHRGLVTTNHAFM